MCVCVCVPQALLKQTEAEHPDYYLLLVCIQQFRSFTVQYHHLVQRNQELLVQSHKEAKRFGSYQTKIWSFFHSLAGTSQEKLVK